MLLGVKVNKMSIHQKSIHTLLSVLSVIFGMAVLSVTASAQIRPTTTFPVNRLHSTKRQEAWLLPTFLALG